MTSENQEPMIENISTKVKEFLQDAEQFPVLEPSKWYAAIVKFVQKVSTAALQQQQLEADTDATASASSSAAEASSAEATKKRKAKKIALEKEILVQIQLDLVHNLTNGTIEDYWLLYQDAEQEYSSSSSSDADENNTNTNNDDDDDQKKKPTTTSAKEPITNLVKKPRLSKLVWSEIDKVAWTNYRERQKKEKEEAERKSKLIDEASHNIDETAEETPMEIVSPSSNDKDGNSNSNSSVTATESISTSLATTPSAAAAAAGSEEIIAETNPHHGSISVEEMQNRHQKIAENDRNRKEQQRQQQNNNRSPKAFTAEQLEVLRNDALRPFRVEYERAFTILDKQLFDHTEAVLELDNFCDWSSSTFNPPYKQKEGEPNNRTGTVYNWLYLPNYSMNQDEDLVIDTYPLMREIRYLARDFPEYQLMKEDWCLEIFAHQTRDSLCGTMIELADRPWGEVIYPTIMNAYGPSLKILSETEKAVEYRDRRLKKKREQEQRKKREEAAEAAEDGTATNDNNDDTSQQQQQQQQATPAKKAMPNYYFGTTLIKILLRAKPDKKKKKTTSDENDEEPRKAADDETTIASVTSAAAVPIEDSPVVSPRAADDDVQDEEPVSSPSPLMSMASNENNNKKEEDEKKNKSLLSKADAAEIACCLTKCSAPALETVLEAVCEYEGVPPGSKTGERVACYDINIKRLHLPVVVFKDPKMGFVLRSSTLYEDWCVIQ